MLSNLKKFRTSLRRLWTLTEWTGNKMPQKKTCSVGEGISPVSHTQIASTCSFCPLCSAMCEYSQLFNLLHGMGGLEIDATISGPQRSLNREGGWSWEKYHPILNDEDWAMWSSTLPKLQALDSTHLAYSSGGWEKASTEDISHFDNSPFSTKSQARGCPKSNA